MLMKTETIEKIYKQLTPESSREFAYFSANLQHICGLPLGAAHLHHYHRLKQYFTEQAAIDLRSGLTAGTTNQPFKHAIDQGPSLFVSFLYGSYRTLPLKILAQGRSICVLLSQDVHDVYADYYRKLLDIPRVHGESRACLYLLKAEDPTLFFKLREMVANDISISVYADGAKGTLSLPSERGLQKVRLLNATIPVRTGYLDFSYLLGIASYVVIVLASDPAKAKEGESAVFCYKIPARKNRKEFVADSSVEIYRSFGKILDGRPFLWEALLYLHRSSVPVSESFDQQADDRIIPFLWQQERYILDRYTYRSFRVDNGNPL
jgi:hypothetical protein